MNIAITDGLVLTPSAFAEGLDQWSSENGTAGSASYESAPNAALVAADQDFGTCLELVKTQTTQKLRYMGQTPIIPGVYLRIVARVKAISGNLPSVRIAGYAMSAANVHVGGLTELGAEVALTQYGEVVEVSAIVGSGSRGGVAMSWGTTPAYGHFGLDLTGLTGGVVRIEDVVIEDVTEAFLRDMMDWVDVRDFGAKGDGVTDDRAAFAAADAVADGRDILVPEGSYYIGSSLSIDARVRFVGTLTMPTAARLALQANFDFPTYARAFGNEEMGLKKGIQALLAFTDHSSFDLCGRRVELSGPIDVAAIAPDVSSYSSRRVITNGQISAMDSTAWADTVVSSVASYSTSAPVTLTSVANVANIAVGSRVTGTGVGREIFVRDRNIGAGTITLSQPLYGGSGTRTLTFTRHKYVFDFSGLSALSRFTIDNVEFLLNGFASCILLADTGDSFNLRDCYVNRPKDRVISSKGMGCDNLSIDRCHFLSNEQSTPAQDRTSVCFNVNGNDTKIRDSRFVRFGLTMIFDGTGHLIEGNHWFQGDGGITGARTPGVVFCQPNVMSFITGNYIDNCIIEWTNEYAADPNFGAGYSFGGLTVTGNIFTASNTASWFHWFSVKPYGTGHFVHGLSVTGNVFKSVNATIDRIERVDTTFAALDNSRMRNVVFEGNMFNGISQLTANPVFLSVDQASAQSVWTAEPAAYLPFGGWARNVEALLAVGPITNAAGGLVSTMPYAKVEQGASKDQITLHFAEAAKGRMNLKVRMDNPN